MTWASAAVNCDVAPTPPLVVTVVAIKDVLDDRVVDPGECNWC